MNIQLLEKIIKYVNESEEAFSVEYGSALSKEQLIQLKKMPEFYYEVLKEIETIQTIDDFIQKQKPLENDFQKVLNEHFWDLLSN